MGLLYSGADWDFQTLDAIHNACEAIAVGALVFVVGLGGPLGDHDLARDRAPGLEAPLGAAGGPPGPQTTGQLSP